MESRWALLGFGLFFVIVLLGNLQQGNTVLSLVSVVFTILGFGGLWWNTTRETLIETRFS